MMTGRTVLVAGAGPGLGQEIATVARREGADVMLGARTEARLAAIAAEVDGDGDHVGWARADLAVADDCAALVAATVERFGRLDAVVTCAVAGDDLVGGLDGADFAAWQSLFDVNLFGALRVVSAAAPHLAGGGAVVFIGSQTAYFSNVMQPGYAATKAALLGVAAHLAVDLGPRGIRVEHGRPGLDVGAVVGGSPPRCDGRRSERPRGADQQAPAVAAHGRRRRRRRGGGVPRLRTGESHHRPVPAGERWGVRALTVIDAQRRRTPRAAGA